MSKLRENVTARDEELAAPAEGDLRPYVIFTQLNERAPHVYAGWLDAPDDEMAITFAREHYGRDQECVSIRAVPRAAIAGTEREYAPSGDEDAGPARLFEVFVQEKAGEPHTAAGTIEATGGAAALAAARGQHPDAHSVWTIAHENIVETGPDEVIWRLTDQTYRLARGYASEVRDKWKKIRQQRDLEQYEKEDLQEAF